LDATVLPPEPKTDDDRPGRVGEDGVRRFATNEEAEEYGEEFLDDPDTNPHAYPNLPVDQRTAIEGYTDPDRDPYNRVLRAPDHWSRQLVLAEVRSNGGPGFALYELTGPLLRPPTMADVTRAHARRDDLTEAQRAVVDDIMGHAPGAREQRLDHWRRRAGYAGRLSDSYGRFPSVGDILDRVRLIDEAIGRNPLPEPLLAHRGLHTVDFMTGYDPNDLNALVGTVQTDSAFLSTSLGVRGRAPDSGHTPFQLHLTLPDGTHGLWLNGYTESSADDRELLLPRGTRYRITGVRTEGTG
ncbi:ADP-ribosyltransferase, partial [Nocardiopsis lucentensis]|uniref:ADP-ribosyltransferase n=1 Tax=Nocardiopsis lucentensis TaxID=53441 RepID=UPI000593D1CC